MNIRIVEEDLQIDPREHVIEHYGHGSYYTTHMCLTCEQERPCSAQLCKLPYDIECLPCLQTELLQDTVRFAKEARQFIGAEVPTDLQGLMWWKALRSEVDGKLKGLAERSGELQKRMDLESGKSKGV